jgi:hypothetical protein
MLALRNIARVSRAQKQPLAVCYTRRFAHGDYGGDQSGHEKSDAAPKRDLEHPGPESPASKGSSSSSSGSSTASKSSNLSHTEAKSDQGSPTNNQPKSAAEENDPEVRKHNEEMAQRHEKSANQLSEKDNKVPPG